VPVFAVPQGGQFGPPGPAGTQQVPGPQAGPGQPGGNGYAHGSQPA
jgi:hypothetical protein